MLHDLTLSCPSVQRLAHQLTAPREDLTGDVQQSLQNPIGVFPSHRLSSSILWNVNMTNSTLCHFFPQTVSLHPSCRGGTVCRRCPQTGLFCPETPAAPPPDAGTQQQPQIGSSSKHSTVPVGGRLPSLSVHTTSSTQRGRHKARSRAAQQDQRAFLLSIFSDYVFSVCWRGPPRI